MLLTLETYCNDNKLTVNVKKTKCMIFKKNGRLIHRTFHCNKIPLENVHLYKYLGFLVSPSGSITNGLEDLRDRAFMKIRSRMGHLFDKYIQNSLNIFDYMIKQILIYACDFWRCHKLPLNNPIDRLYNNPIDRLCNAICRKYLDTNGMMDQLHQPRRECAQIPLSKAQ